MLFSQDWSLWKKNTLYCLPAPPTATLSYPRKHQEPAGELHSDTPVVLWGRPTPLAPLPVGQSGRSVAAVPVHPRVPLPRDYPEQRLLPGHAFCASAYHRFRNMHPVYRTVTEAWRAEATKPGWLRAQSWGLADGSLLQ